MLLIPEEDDDEAAAAAAAAAAAVAAAVFLLDLVDMSLSLTRACGDFTLDLITCIRTQANKEAVTGVPNRANESSTHCRKRPYLRYVRSTLGHLTAKCVLLLRVSAANGPTRAGFRAPP